MYGSHENLPYGPLTYEDFTKLAVSFHNGSPQDVQETARSRGITPQDHMRVHFSMAKLGLASPGTNNPAVASPDIKSSLREVVDGMPTPRTAGDALGLFVALEGIEIEEGRSTAEQSKRTLSEVFDPRRRG